MLQAVLFDLDGTLANTDPIHLDIWRAILEPEGYVVDEAFFKQHISGRLNKHLIQDLLPRLSETEGQELAVEKEAQFRALAASELERTPGLTTLLGWIADNNLKTAVVTNAPRANAEFMLKVLELETTFDHLIVAGELARSKPDPLPYKTALNHFGVSPEGAIAFEDSKTGIQSAVSAQISTIGVASTHTPEVLQHYGASLVIRNFMDSQLQQFGLLL